MYVMVHARNADDDSYTVDETRKWEFEPGKASRVETDEYDIICRGDDMLLRGASIEESDQGEPKMVRRFVVNLSKRDLEKITQAARGLR